MPSAEGTKRHYVKRLGFSFEGEDMPTLTESRTPALHQQHSYKMNPPTPVGCEVSWSINGKNVTVGSNVGGLSVKGFAASGEMTVEVEGDTSNTEVSVRLLCPGVAPAIAGPMAVGAGVWPAVAGPAGPAGVPPPPVFALNQWSWWDKFGGTCPGTWTIGNVQCVCNQAPTYGGLWPFYYTITCTFNCPGFQVTTLTWTLSFGFVTDGPK